MTDAEVSLGKKVNWTWFFTALLAIGAIQAGAWAVLRDDVKELRAATEAKLSAISEDSSETKAAVFELRGRLQSFELIEE